MRPSCLKVLQYSGGNSYFLLNHAMSLTERGTFNVLPFLPSLDFSVLTLCSPVLLTVFSATFCPAEAALDAAAFVLVAAFFAVDLALVVAFFAEDFAFAAAALVLVAAFFAVDLALVVAFFAVFFATAARSFLEMAALMPAFASPFAPALLIPDADFIPASLSFCAVALPTPGIAISVARGSFFGFAAMSSPNYA